MLIDGFNSLSKAEQKQFALAHGFKSFSQSGQEEFAFANASSLKTFLDIGSMSAFSASNSYALESLGWKGLAVDFDVREVTAWPKNRRTPVLLMDAMKVDWKTVLPKYDLGPVIGYLSLDIYGGELQVLRDLHAAGISFRCATIEHDSLGIKFEPRDAIREFMFAQGYTLAVADVLNPGGTINGVVLEGQPYEDWWTR